MHTPSSHTPVFTTSAEKSGLFAESIDHSLSDHSMYGPSLPEIDTAPLNLHYRESALDPDEPSSSVPNHSTRPSSLMTGDFPPAYQSLRHLSMPVPVAVEPPPSLPLPLVPLRPADVQGILS